MRLTNTLLLLVWVLLPWEIFAQPVAEKRGKTFVFPIITRSLETGWNFGAVSAIIFPINRLDTVSRSSNIVVVGMFWCYVTGNLPVLSSSWPEFSRYKKPSKWGVKWGRHTNHPPQSTQCTPTTTTTTLLMVVRNQPARPPMDNNNGCGPAHLHHTDCKRQVHKMVHI